MEALVSHTSGCMRLNSFQSLRITDAAPLQTPQIARRSHRCCRYDGPTKVRDGFSSCDFGWQFARGLSRSTPRFVTRMSQQAAPEQLAVKTFEGTEAGSASLSLRVADTGKAKGLVHRHVVTILQNRRQGSANTKTRAEVRGGGKKPFAQKGTGNARQGSRTTPLKPGGGVVFGPKPKDWSIKMNKKERRLAIATALQSAAASITVVDDIKSKITEAKTKVLVNAFSGLGLDLAKDHVLLIVDDLTENLHRSGRNIANLAFNETTSLNTYDILRADRIVMDKASLEFINEFYSQKPAST